MLCSEGFIEAIEPEKWGYMEENGLMTDILALKEKGLEVSCIKRLMWLLQCSH